MLSYGELFSLLMITIAGDIADGIRYSRDESQSRPDEKNKNIAKFNHQSFS
jgi:hypothetical protein